jgi:hypothetical protein
MTTTTIDFKISACNKCGERYPSAPSGTIHKCGMCSGRMIPLESPTLDDLLAVAKYSPTVNTQPMEEWKKQVKPTAVTTFDGKPLTDMTREELINACESLGTQLNAANGVRSSQATDANFQRPYQVYDFIERLHGEDQSVTISTFLNKLADIPTVSGIVSVSQTGESKYHTHQGWITQYCICFTHRHLPLDKSDLRDLGRAE